MNHNPKCIHKNRKLRKIYFILVIILTFMHANTQSSSAAVNLLYFLGIPGNGSVLLQWRTGGEINLAGFNLYRSVNPTSNFARINQNTVPSSGDPLLGAYYEFSDPQLTNGTVYYYRLEFVKSDQTTELFGPLQVTPGSSVTGEAPLTPGTPIGATATTQLTTPTAPLTQTPTSAPIIPTITAISTVILETPLASLTEGVPSELSSTPEVNDAIAKTITPIDEINLEATGTAIAYALSTKAAELTPATTEETDTQINSQNMLRIGLLFLVATIWILLGVWLYIYLSKMNSS